MAGGRLGTTLINGKPVTPYTSQANDAMTAEGIRQGTAAGQAQGAQQDAATKTARDLEAQRYATSQNQGLAARTLEQTRYDQNQKRYSDLSASMMGLINGQSSGGVGGGAGLTVPSAPHMASVDTTGAQAAEFARAKDRSGQMAQGALTGLRSALGGRGMLGSGAESRGTASVINKSQGELGDVNRQQAITGADLAQKNAETNYQGGITQRGQDIQYQESQNNLVAQQAQAQASQRQTILMGLLNSLSSSARAY